MRLRTILRRTEAIYHKSDCGCNSCKSLLLEAVEAIDVEGWVKVMERLAKEVYEGKTLKELDAENEKRARYYNYYTGKKWGEASNYDLIVNTSNAPLDNIADAIIEYINTVK